MPRLSLRHWAYLSVFLTALAIRAGSSWPYFFADFDPGYRNFEYCDSSYQVRRTEITLQDYPVVPFHDSYHYFPDNPRIPWPMGYNLLLATLAKPVDLLFHSRTITETALGFIPCVLDALTLLLFLRFFSCLVAFRTAWIAALFGALSFVNVQYAELGCIDHHYFITLMTAVTALLLFRYEQTPTRTNAVILGAAIGSSIFFNVSSIQYSLLFLLTLLLLSLRKEATPEFKRGSFWVYGSSFAWALASSLSTPAGRLLQIRYDETSLFQPLLILFAGVGASVVLLRHRKALSAALVAAVLLLVALLATNILEGAKFLMFGNVLNGVQGEEASVFKYADQVQAVFTWGALLVPLGVASFWKKRRAHSFLGPVLGVFFIYGAVCGLSHWAYVQFFYPWYALVVAEGLLSLWDRLAVSGKRWARLALCGAIVLQPVYIVALYTLNLSGAKTELRGTLGQTIQSFAWLREHSQATSFQQTGGGEPEYAVVANRDYGHLIVRHAQRPVLASPFSTPDFLPHMIDYSRYVFARDEAEMLASLAGYRARYWVVDSSDNSMLEFYLGILKKGSPGDFERFSPEVDPSSWLRTYRNSLLFLDGDTGGQEVRSPEHLRLIYEAPTQKQIRVRIAGEVRSVSYPRLKIYERVAGARLSLSRLIPGDRVELRIPVRTNAGRAFTYRRTGTADGGGRLAWVIPYATAGKNVELLVNQQSREAVAGFLQIAEPDILDGREVIFPVGMH